MVTRGGGGLGLDREARGKWTAPPDSKPRRPSSQLTLAPSRVQACATAGPLPPAPIADIRSENTSARLMVMLPPAIDLSPSSIVTRDRSKVQCFRIRKQRRSDNIK